MIDFDLSTILFFSIIFFPIYLITAKEKGEFFIHSLFFFYLLGVLSVTFFPIPYQDMALARGREHAYLSNNFYPLASIIEILEDGRSYVIIRQLLGNLILLLPLGFFIPLLFPQKRSWTKVLGIGFLTSLSIESLQLLLSWLLGFTYKIFDVDDLWLNTLGVLFGYGLWRLWEKVKKFLPIVGNKNLILDSQKERMGG